MLNSRNWNIARFLLALYGDCAVTYIDDDAAKPRWAFPVNQNLNLFVQIPPKVLHCSQRPGDSG